MIKFNGTHVENLERGTQTNPYWHQKRTSAVSRLNAVSGRVDFPKMVLGKPGYSELYWPDILVAPKIFEKYPDHGKISPLLREPGGFFHGFASWHSS